MKSLLDDVPGVGVKRRIALMRKFRDMASLSKASVEEIASVKGMTRTTAEAVFHHMRDLIASWSDFPEPPAES